MTRNQVNSLLYGRADLFEPDGQQPPRWSLVTESQEGSVESGNRRLSRAEHLAQLRSELFPWQARALHAWEQHDRRGVVEAVTGAGKTHVGLAAIGEALEDGYRALVVVPTTVLLGQWAGRIQRHLGIRPAQLGAGHRGDLRRDEVVVCTVQSASRTTGLLPPQLDGLLVCDEVHRYGANLFAQVLQPNFERRLGMTATFERNDDGLKAHLEPYFDRSVFKLDYRDALDESVIARFRVAIVRVDLTADEQGEYERAAEEAKAARWALVLNHGVPQDPFGTFMRAVADLADGPRRHPATKQARRFLSNFTKCRQILGETEAKLPVLRHASEAIRRSQGTLVFASTVAGAKRASDTLRSEGISAHALDGEMPLKEREEILELFGRREVLATVAPLVLDEGVDVPEANLAVILAASKTRRQMIQRLGRVVRRKEDGGNAHLALLVARGTSEDPATGAHMDFIREMLEVADELRLFDSRSHDELSDFLNGGSGGEPFVLPEVDPDRRDEADKRTVVQEMDIETIRRVAATLTARTQAQPPASTASDHRLPLHDRIANRLQSGPRTALGLSGELRTLRSNVVQILESSDDFVARGVQWYLADQTPPEEPIEVPVPGPPPSLRTITGAPEVALTDHPLVQAWGELRGPLDGTQLLRFERAMRFVLPGISDLAEAREFVARNQRAILRKMRV